MIGWTKNAVPQDPEAPKARDRRRNRVRVVLLRCWLGDVVDLSQTGMRVRSRRKPLLSSEPEPITLIGGAKGSEEELALTARVVWVRRSGLFHHEIGLTFVNMTEATAAAVARLARDYLDAEVLRPRDSKKAGQSAPNAPAQMAERIKDAGSAENGRRTDAA